MTSIAGRMCVASCWSNEAPNFDFTRSFPWSQNTLSYRCIPSGDSQRSTRKMDHLLSVCAFDLPLRVLDWKVRRIDKVKRGTNKNILHLESRTFLVMQI